MAKRRARNRRRQRRRWVLEHVDAGNEEELRARLAEVRQRAASERDAVEQHKEDVESSARGVAADASSAAMRQVYVGNIAYSASALDVVHFLTGRLQQHCAEARLSAEEAVSGIVRCKLHTTRGNASVSRGSGFVTVASQKVVDLLLSLSSSSLLLFRLRNLRVAESNRKVEMDRLDQISQKFNVVAIKLGAPFASQICESGRRRRRSRTNAEKQPKPWEAEDWCVQWEADDHVVVELMGSSRTLAVEFESPKRSGVTKTHLEIPMQSIYPGTVQLQKQTNTQKLALVMCLRRPPRLFVASSESASASVDSLLSSLTSSMLLAPLLSGVRSRFEWQAGAVAARHSDSWSRTVDQCTWNGAFGRCRCLRIVLSDNAGELLHQLCDFGLINSGSVRPSSLVGRLDHSRVKEGVGWSGTARTDEALKHLNFDVLYALSCLISTNRLDLLARPDLSESMAALLRDTRAGLAASALEKMVADESVWFYHDPVQSLQAWIDSLQQSHEALPEYDDYENATDDDGDDDVDDSLYVQRVCITPLRVITYVPELSMSNRVLRHFAALESGGSSRRFVRICFVDENLGSFLQACSPGEVMVEQRVRQLLRDGLFIAGRRFVFLAYSNSQLREHGCWFYDELSSLSADGVRRWMGDLSRVTTAGKQAARLGQCFSNTIGTVRIDDHEWEHCEDVTRNGYCFSDGVGRISEGLAEAVRSALGLSGQKIPSAFQVRFAGAKGVLTVVKTGQLKQKKLWIRPSQNKFDSEHRVLEVITYARCMPFYLNRQIISVLSALGIDDDAFLRLQDDQLHKLDGVLVDRDQALTLLQGHSCIGEGAPMRVAWDLLTAGFEAASDPHLSGMLRALRHRLHLDLQAKARILVPKAVCLIGVMDECNVLPADTVFVQYQRNGEEAHILQRQVLVGRNPSLHCGDLRLLQAVDAPQLRHLTNVIVFPATGDRPLPNQMSGGDLDGDIFFCIWNRMLLPDPSRQVPPMQFDDATAPAVRSRGGGVSVEHIQEHFCNYILNDRLGMIANAFCVHADVHEDGAASPECQQLAKLHSTAVDFAKTGVPAEMPRELRAPPKYPDFMQNRTRPSYESTKVQGRLYRIARGHLLAPLHVERCFDEQLSLPESQEYVEEACTLRDLYNLRLWQLMSQFGVYNEAELCSGYVEVFRKQARRPRVAADSQHRLNMALEELQRSFNAFFWNGIDAEEKEERRWAALNKASAWYRVCYDDRILCSRDGKTSSNLLSFAWLQHRHLCQIKRISQH